MVIGTRTGFKVLIIRTNLLSTLHYGQRHHHSCYDDGHDSLRTLMLPLSLSLSPHHQSHHQAEGHPKSRALRF